MDVWVKKWHISKVFGISSSQLVVITTRWKERDEFIRIPLLMNFTMLYVSGRNPETEIGNELWAKRPLQYEESGPA